MSRILLLASVCVAVFAAGCPAQTTDRASADKPEGSGSKQDGAKPKSLDDLTRGVAGDADAALKAKPDDIEALWKKASAEFHLKDHKASRAAVEVGLKKSGDDPRFRFLSAALSSVEGESEKSEEGQRWFLKRDKSYTMALSRLPMLAKKEGRAEFHDAYQAAWLIAEGHATQEAKAVIERDPGRGALALLSTAWSPWHTDEQNQRLQDTLVAVGKPARPMLEGSFDTVQQNFKLLTNDYNTFCMKAIDLAGELGLRSGEPGIQEKQDAAMKKVEERGERYRRESTSINRQLKWMKETYERIKD